MTDRYALRSGERGGLGALSRFHLDENDELDDEGWEEEWGDEDEAEADDEEEEWGGRE